MPLHIEADCRKYAFGNYAIIGSDNGWWPIRRQNIIWTNAGLFVDWIVGGKLKWNVNQSKMIFIQGNLF